IRESPKLRGSARAPIHAVSRSEPLLLTEVMVELDIQLIGLARIDSLAEPVVYVREGQAFRCRLGIIRQDRLSDLALHRDGNDIAWKRISQSSSRRVLIRVEGVIDGNELAVRCAGVTEIAGALEKSRNGLVLRRSGGLTSAFIVEEEECAVAA